MERLPGCLNPQSIGQFSIKIVYGYGILNSHGHALIVVPNLAVVKVRWFFTLWMKVQFPIASVYLGG